VDRGATPRRLSAFGAPLALACAVALATVCILPFLVWGNLYVPQVRQYWLVYGVPTCIAGIIFAVAPARALRELPGAVARTLLRPRPLAFALLAAGLATTLAAGIAWFALERYPGTSDEVAQLWHARMLAHGRLALPADPNPEFFAIDNVIDTGAWYSHFPIGGPLVLLPGVMLGVPWLVNPVLTGATVALTYQFARRAFGELPGRASAVLLATAPGVLLLSGTYMNHAPTTCLAMAALVALIEWARATTARKRFALAAIIGLATGAAASVRPLDGVVVAVVAGGAQLWVVRGDRERWREIAVTVAGGLVGVAPLLVANWLTNGSPLRFGYDVMWGQGHRVGFHPDPMGERHTFDRAVEYASRYVSALNFSLTAWPVPAMALVFAGLAAMRRTTRWDAVLLLLACAQVAAYASYWGLAEFLGPRFLSTALPAIVIVLARTPFLVAERSGIAAGRGVAMLMVVGVAVAWSTPAEPFSALGAGRKLRHTRQFMRVDVPGAVREAGVHHAVVFIREKFSTRLIRRMWGVGVSRSDAVALIDEFDTCSLLAGVRAAEADTARSRTQRAATVRRHAVPFTAGPQNVRTLDPEVSINSPASLTPECRAEIDRAGDVPVSFGAALPHEPIDAGGRLDGGDVVYAMDLGERNEVLRARFSGRAWYRLVASVERDGRYTAALHPY
jgi:hypothetical protein